MAIEEWFGGVLATLDDSRPGLKDWSNGALEALVGGSLDCIALAGAVAGFKGLQAAETLVLLVSLYLDRDAER